MISPEYFSKNVENWNLNFWSLTFHPAPSLNNILIPFLLLLFFVLFNFHSFVFSLSLSLSLSLIIMFSLSVFISIKSFLLRFYRSDIWRRKMSNCKQVKPLKSSDYNVCPQKQKYYFCVFSIWFNLFKR